MAVLDVRTAQNDLENALKDTILYALKHRLPAVANVAALRAFKTQGASGSQRDDDELINIVVAGVVTAAYRWNTESTAADDNVNTIKPTDVTGAGRWLKWTSLLRMAPTKGGLSYYLHELLDGPVERVVVIDKDMDKDQATQLVSAGVPAVLIDSRGDSPEDLTQDTGHRWDTRFEFVVYIISENMRDQRQAAQGSLVSGDVVHGANTLDGLIWSLLAGTQLYAVVNGIRNVQAGHGSNWVSELAQRRVIRSREYSVVATVENPPASNDAGPAAEVDTQARMTDLGSENTTLSLTDYLVDGLDVTDGPGLTKTVRVGSAYIANAPVTYAGALHTFTASTDTYRDLLPNGTIAFVEVGPAQAEPAITATALRIGVTSTDGSGVTSDRIIAERRAPYGNPITTPLT